MRPIDEQNTIHSSSAAGLLPPEQRKKALSGSRLSVLLVAFVTALLLATGGMVFLLVSSIFAWLTPSIREDLQWKARRAAVEISQSADLGILLGDAKLIEASFAGVAGSRDIQAIVVTNLTGQVLAMQGRPPNTNVSLLAGPSRSLREGSGYIVSWAESMVEGTAIGRVAVVVSTGRLDAGQQLRRKLLETVGVGTLLGILICILFVRLYIRPLLRLTENAFLKLEKAAIELAHKQRLEQELEIGARIQTCILPKCINILGLQVASEMRPASEVGGDYFDIFPVNDGCWIGIGDVAGHGLTSGLIMLMAQSAVATLARSNPDTPPHEIVTQLNAVLYDNVRNRLKHEEHVTFTLLRYHHDGTVVFAGAHEYIVVWRAKTRTCVTISTPGMWLGIIPDISRITKDSVLKLEQDDLMVLYTDGITEAMTAMREQYGVNRLCAVIEAHADESVENVRTAVLGDVAHWRATQRDDETLLVIRYVGRCRPEFESSRGCHLASTSTDCSEAGVNTISTAVSIVDGAAHCQSVPVQLRDESQKA
jgi:serine phosphatase RsbU (regulator of sigma subunit)